MASLENQLNPHSLISNTICLLRICIWEILQPFLLLHGHEANKATWKRLWKRTQPHDRHLKWKTREGHCRDSLPGSVIFHVPLPLCTLADLQVFPTANFQLWNFQRKSCWIAGLRKSTLLKSCPASTSGQLRSLWHGSAFWLTSPANLYPRTWYLAHSVAQPIMAEWLPNNHKPSDLCPQLGPKFEPFPLTLPQPYHSCKIFLNLPSLCWNFFVFVLIKRTWDFLWSGGKLLESFLFTPDV